MKHILLLLLLLSFSCKDSVIVPLQVTTSYSGSMLTATVNSKDSLVRGFYLGVWNGKEVEIGNPVTEYGVGNFALIPTLKPSTTYYIWAFAYKRGNENNAGIGNTIIVNN